MGGRSAGLSNFEGQKILSPMFPFEKNILGFIHDEQCALVVGPEIMRFDGKPMNQYVRDRLAEQYDGQVSHYYKSDGLFAFPAADPEVKSNLAKDFKNECLRLPQTAGYDEALLKKIAQIPFHLIISTNPDTFLSDVFYKFGIRHRFSYFRKGDKASDAVVRPTREEPLIYNISGCILEDESIVLDFEDLYSLIGSSFGAAGMPEELQKALGGIKKYVFIGFNFEKWHTQLLVRILCGKVFYKKYAGPHDVAPETKAFLTNQFNVEIWDPASGDFMDKFLDTASKFTVPGSVGGSTFLRQLAAEPLAPAEVNIVREVRNGQMLKAIGLLAQYATATDFEMDAVHLSSRFSRASDDQSKMDSRDFTVIMNQIADEIVELARRIAKKKK